jgi:hypothetical protein
MRADVEGREPSSTLLSSRMTWQPVSAPKAHLKSQTRGQELEVGVKIAVEGAFHLTTGPSSIRVPDREGQGAGSHSVTANWIHSPS